MPPKARLGTLSHPVCKGAQDPGESPGLRSPFSRNQPRPAPGVGGTRRAERRGDAGLLLCGPGKRGPALGGDPTGNEHLHESQWSHPPCSRWTPTRGGQPEAVRGGGRGLEGAGPEVGCARGCGRGVGGPHRGRAELQQCGTCACSGSDVTVPLCGE